MSKNFNIIYIHSHDTGRYISPYGYATPTPTLQKFAEEGVTFRKAFCTAPTCSPSRAALLTGKYPHQVGMLGLVNRGFCLNDFNDHIVQHLKSQGYSTALSGVQHVAPDPEMIGYDEVLPNQESYRDPNMTSMDAINFIKRDHQKPFFLDVGFWDTHRIYPEADSEDNPNFVSVPPTLPDTPEVREDIARYYSSARRLDKGIKDIINTIDQIPQLKENTLIIITTDHGIPFPNHKCSLKDSGTGVMLMMRGLKDFWGGKVVDEMVSQLDLFPTIFDLLNIPTPSGLSGKSLLPLLRNEVSSLHESLYSEVTFHSAYEPKRAIRTKQWKYIQRFDDRNLSVLSNCDNSLSKDKLVSEGWKDQAIDTEEFYDLTFDPNEMNNLIHDQQYSSVIKECKEKLLKWMEDTNDPLLKGQVSPPEGITLVSPDAISV